MYILKSFQDCHRPDFNSYFLVRTHMVSTYMPFDICLLFLEETDDNVVATFKPQGGK